MWGQLGAEYMTYPDGEYHLRVDCTSIMPEHSPSRIASRRVAQTSPGAPATHYGRMCAILRQLFSIRRPHDSGQEAFYSTSIIRNMSTTLTSSG